MGSDEETKQETPAPVLGGQNSQQRAKPKGPAGLFSIDEDEDEDGGTFAFTKD